MTQKRIVIFLADGFEEVEAVTPIDLLRRAGVEVVIVGVQHMQPRGAHGITILADVPESSSLDKPIDGVILPGGMPGAENLASSSVVQEVCRSVMDKAGLVAAICAAPAVVLGSFGLLRGRKFTCYPGFEEGLRDADFLSDRVVIDGNLITSRGPGTAGEFALALVRHLVGDEEADNLVRVGLFQ